MAEIKIKQIVETGDGNSGMITVLTENQETGKEYASTQAFGSGTNYSKADATEKASQDSINKH